MKRTILSIIGLSIIFILSAFLIAEARDYPDELQLFINYAQIRNKPTPTPTPTPQPTVKQAKNKPTPKQTPKQPAKQQSYGTGEIQSLIIQYAKQYGIAADAPLCIAKHESGFNPNSKNKSSSASGVFQYLSGTWAATDEGKAGLSVLNADANIRAAVKYMGVHRSTKPWVAAKKCPPLKFL